MKHTSTDDGDKPEKVYKYNDQDRLSDSDDSQESSPRPVCISDVTLATSSRCTWHLHADPQYVYDNNSVR
jgi:hypothetical protein